MTAQTLAAAGERGPGEIGRTLDRLELGQRELVTKVETGQRDLLAKVDGAFGQLVSRKEWELVRAAQDERITDVAKDVGALAASIEARRAPWWSAASGFAAIAALGVALAAMFGAPP